MTKLSNINIRDEGLRILASGTGVAAYRPDVRLNSGRKKNPPLSNLLGSELTVSLWVVH